MIGPFEPIGVIRTPFADRRSAPRQSAAARDTPGRIELVPGRSLEDAISDLERFTHLWVIYAFHLNRGWRPKVLPPRSTGRRRGALATRSPHRPNPIGLTAVELVKIDGLVLHVRGVDMIDGSPVLDLKPYLPYADAIPDASHGWLDADPEPAWRVEWSELARVQVDWLRREHGIDLRTGVEQTLALGPQPHAYRRIRRERDGAMRLAHRDWRLRFRADEAARAIVVDSIHTGHRARDLAGTEPELEPHRAFVARFGG